MFTHNKETTKIVWTGSQTISRTLSSQPLQNYFKNNLMIFIKLKGFIQPISNLLVKIISIQKTDIKHTVVKQEIRRNFKIRINIHQEQQFFQTHLQTEIDQ